jgi:glutamate-1-semialdehyde aminotransferase
MELNFLRSSKTDWFNLISRKMISHGVKLSQKQRKMIALTTKDNNSGMNNMETALSAPSKIPKPANAWYALIFIKISFVH